MDYTHNHDDVNLLNGEDKKVETAEMEFDQLLTDYVGQNGRYQMCIATLLAFTSIPMALSLMEIVFLNLAPTYYCDVTPLSPALSALNLSELMYLSIPNAVAAGDGYEPESCIQYDRNYAEATEDDIERWRGSEATKTIYCSKWMYEKSRIDDTITTKVRCSWRYMNVCESFHQVLYLFFRDSNVILRMQITLLHLEKLNSIINLRYYG